ncbi:MAG: hypothetical protein AUJ74_06300 [Candidatus Omnitrophica bacterium CG1_02_44_16]|nr:MAG: hypothetical protein AUJ74_06300 [Candidatus Omnitrophica bacterium CG1_02_44_16]PIY83021.1 MAG: ABC transporter ATP-binding protein [Candidatus Omnitrophica bacterium CG_4_10_14_0_8_um_filter_44_12]PIZ83590.1 MAG: ABC transporter ATP-binding protein [Candidatus Omnitrophica bacterium CG_4_10_14_0_2_um_filter_44_9]
MKEAIAVSVKDVSKKYRLYNSPRERFFEAVHPFGKKFHREFLALKNVSFNVPKGKTVGIIGRNGSGKSTLLSIICSILKPTSGVVEANGRISSLLELGGGFNPDLTGRENVLINGQISGFSASEMKKRLPEIEAFADIGEFFDQPVKIYSSGMFVRLAFAAAINVDPDILILDEALAVGDAKFQHKCFLKFREFQENKKTIIFVGHDMQAILRYCDTVLLLNAGLCVNEGGPEEVVSHYFDILAGIEHKQVSPLKSTQPVKHKEGAGLVKNFIEAYPAADLFPSHHAYNKNEIRHGSLSAELIDFLIVNQHEEEISSFNYGDIINLYVKARINKTVVSPHVGFLFNSLDNYAIYGVNTQMLGIPLNMPKQGNIYVCKFSINAKLSAGDYFIDLGIGEFSNGGYTALDRRCGVINIRIDNSPQFSGIVDIGASFTEIPIIP